MIKWYRCRYLGYVLCVYHIFSGMLCAAEVERKQQEVENKELQSVADVRAAVYELDQDLTRAVNALAVARNNPLQLESARQFCIAHLGAGLQNLELMKHRFSPMSYLYARLADDMHTKQYLDTLWLHCFVPFEQRMKMVKGEISLMQQSDIGGIGDIQNYLFGCRAFWRALFRVGNQQDVEMQRIQADVMDARSKWTKELAINSAWYDTLLQYTGRGDKRVSEICRNYINLN